MIVLWIVGWFLTSPGSLRVFECLPSSCGFGSGKKQRWVLVKVLEKYYTYGPIYRRLGSLSRLDAKGILVCC